MLDLDWDRDAGVIGAPVMQRHDAHASHQSTDVINPVHRLNGGTGQGVAVALPLGDGARGARMGSPGGIEMEPAPTQPKARRPRGDQVCTTRVSLLGPQGAGAGGAGPLSEVDIPVL